MKYAVCLWSATLTERLRKIKVVSKEHVDEWVNNMEHLPEELSSSKNREKDSISLPAFSSNLFVFLSLKEHKRRLEKYLYRSFFLQIAWSCTEPCLQNKIINLY